MKRAAKQGMTYAEAAAECGCSTNTVHSAATKHGRIKLHSDGSIEHASLAAWHAGRSSIRRGNVRRVQAAARPINEQSSLQSAPGFDTPVRLSEENEACIEAATAACAIGTGAYNLACVLAHHGIEADLLVGIVMQWATWQRWEWVGGPANLFGSIAEVDKWPTPPSGTPWSASRLFRGDPLTDADWEAVAGIVEARLRAAQGARSR